MYTPIYNIELTMHKYAAIMNFKIWYYNKRYNVDKNVNV